MWVINKDLMKVLPQIDVIRTYLYYRNDYVKVDALAQVAQMHPKNVYSALAVDLRKGRVTRKKLSKDGKRNAFHYSLTLKGAKCYDYLSYLIIHLDRKKVKDH